MYLFKRGCVYYLALDDGSRISTHTRTKNDALRFLNNFNKGIEQRKRSLQRITLKDFTSVLYAYSQGIHTASTARSDKSALNELTRFLGDAKLVSAVSVSDCERFLAQKTIEASVWTARKYYLALAAAFERAKTWGHCTTNPWREVKKPKTPEMIPVYFTREQIRTLLDVIDDRDLRELVIVAVLTGLRQGELLAMEWDWVDLTRRVITVKNTEGFTTKSKRVRVVPICEDAMTVFLSRWERFDVRHKTVFTRKGRPILGNFVTHRFKRYLVKAELPRELHWHSLRHAYASWLVQAGVSLFQVSKLLGHSSTSVNEIYAHLVPQDMHGVLGPLHLDN